MKTNLKILRSMIENSLRKNGEPGLEPRIYNKINMLKSEIKELEMMIIRTESAIRRYGYRDIYRQNIENNKTMIDFNKKTLQGLIEEKVLAEINASAELFDKTGVTFLNKILNKRVSTNESKDKNYIYPDASEFVKKLIIDCKWKMVDNEDILRTVANKYNEDCVLVYKCNLPGKQEGMKVKDTSKDDVFVITGIEDGKVEIGVYANRPENQESYAIMLPFVNGSEARMVFSDIVSGPIMDFEKVSEKECEKILKQKIFVGKTLNREEIDKLEIEDVVCVNAKIKILDKTIESDEFIFDR